MLSILEQVAMSLERHSLSFIRKVVTMQQDKLVYKDRV